MNKIIVFIIVVLSGNIQVFSQNYGVLHNLGSNNYALQNVNLTNNTYDYGVQRTIHDLKIGSNVVAGIPNGIVTMSPTCRFTAQIQNELSLQSGINFSRDAFMQIKHGNKVIMEINKNSNTYIDGVKFASDIYIFNKEGGGSKVKVHQTNFNILGTPQYQNNEILGFTMLGANYYIPTLAVAPYHVFLGGTYYHLESDKTITLQVTGFVQTSGTYLSTSDERLKRNIKEIGDRSSALYNLNSSVISNSTLATKLSESELQNEFIISPKDLETYFPELVVSKNGDMIGVDYIGLIPILIEALKQQQVDLLENDKLIEMLEDKFASIKENTN